MVDETSPEGPEQRGPAQPRRASAILRWLVWLSAVVFFALCLTLHLIWKDPLRLPPVPWWAYGLSAAGLLAYARSLLPVANATTGVVLTGILSVGAWGALLIGPPVTAGPPWVVRDPPFSAPFFAVRHDVYFADPAGYTTVLGLYGFAPIAIAVVLLLRAFRLSRFLSAWSRRAIYAVAAVAFSALAVEVGDRAAGDWFMKRFLETLFLREPSATVTALKELGRNPLCRTSCVRRICQTAFPAPPEPVREALRQFFDEKPGRTCRSDPA